MWYIVRSLEELFLSLLSLSWIKVSCVGTYAVLKKLVEKKYYKTINLCRKMPPRASIASLKSLNATLRVGAHVKQFTYEEYLNERKRNSH